MKKILLPLLFSISSFCYGQTAKTYELREKIKDGLGDYRGAIQDFNKAIQINPDDEYTYWKRGSSKASLGDDIGAIQGFTKAIQIYYPKHNSHPTPLYYQERGKSKIKLGDHRGAIQDFNKAIEIAPEYPWFYYYRGLSKVILGDKNGGCLDFSKAGELGNELGSKQAYEAIKKYCNKKTEEILLTHFVMCIFIGRKIYNNKHKEVLKVIRL